MESLKLNTKAPGFKLFDQNSKEFSLTDHKGQWVLIYFYPKAMTPGCTVQACSLRDNQKKFSKFKCTVVGISPDSVARLKKFEDKEDLNFTLLADEDFSVAKKYKIYGLKKFMGREFMGVIRTSFLISPDQKIAHIFDDVRTKTHHEEVLIKLNELIS